MSQKTLCALSFGPSTLSGHLSHRIVTKSKENQGHIGGDGVLTFGWHIDAPIRDKVCYFKRNGACEYGTDRYFLLFCASFLLSNFFSRNYKGYIFRMMCCLDGSYLHTEAGS